MLFLLAIIVIINFMLGLFVILRSHTKVNVSFFLLILSVIFWTLSNNISDIVGNYFWALTLAKLSYIFTIQIGFFLVLFTYYFPSIKTKMTRLGLGLLIILNLSAVVLLATNYAVTGVILNSWGIDVNSSNLMYYFDFVFFVFIGISFYNLIKKYIHSKGIEKSQLQFMLLGILLTLIGGVLTVIVIPLLTNNWYLSKIGPYFTVFLIGFTTYAIVKHRMMDIRLVVARSFAYLLLLTSLAAFYALTVLGLEALLFPGQLASFDWYQGALRTAIAVIMVFLFQPLRSWITKATDKIFFRNIYNADELLTRLSNTMGSTIVLIELLYKVGDLLTQNLKPSRVLFALTKDDLHIYTIQAQGYKQTPEVDPKDVNKMTKDGIIHLDDLEEGSHMKRLLNEYQATLAVPLKTEGETVGVLMLGEKSSGDMYSQQDMSVLEILAPELAIAVENAKAYEEISRFNTTLRQEVKRATNRLKLKNQQLMELDHAKDEFISMASHQLRTPLTAIKGYLSMLLEGDAGDIKVSQYDFINEAYSGANRMVGLINDLLNVSRMDTGRFFLEPKEVDMEKLVDEEQKQLQNSAKAKGLYLKVEKKGKIPHIWADETKIRQVVMNFMDNAIYYTNTGGVTVRLSHDKNNFIYEVHDTGIGVPPNQREHMFEKFFRADNARTARPDGTGLGIYLAKRVVSDHGGEIIFDSTEGKGSVFGFKFPLKKRIAPAMASAPAPRPAATIPTTIPTATDVTSPAPAIADTTNVK